MKRLEIIFLFLIVFSSSMAATYTGTKPKDLDLATPTEGNTKVSEFNNSDREIKTVITNLENITTVTGTYTVAGTQTGILGSSTTGFTISFPAASTLATGTITKKYNIKNINTGTITLNLTIDGVGSPTVTGSQTFKLYTDGTSWFEERANTAANASNAGLLDNLDSTYFMDATNLSTGTVALARIPGTLTGKDADTTDGYHAGTSANRLLILDSSALVPTANIPTTIPGFVNTSRTISTTAPLAGGGALSSDLTLSIPLATSGQNGYISSADWTTFNNKLSTSRTLYTTTPLTIAGVASADLSADRTIAIATATTSQDGFVKKEDFQLFSNKASIVAGSGITSSSTTGTTTIANNGVLQIIAGTGISITSNGTGTPTITASGTSSAGGWINTGTTTTGNPGLRVVAQGTIAVHVDYGIVGILDRDIPPNITLDNLTQITTRNYNDISGTSTIKPTQIAIGTETFQGALNAVGSATFSGTVTAGGFSGNGAGLTGKENTLSNSAGLAAALSDETGTNTVVFSSGSTQANPTFTGSSNFPSGVWNSSGDAGIGTTTPAKNLHAQGTTLLRHSTPIGVPDSYGETVTIIGNAKSQTFQDNILILDYGSTTLTGSGGAIAFGGRNTSAGGMAHGGFVGISKQNNTEGNVGYDLILGARNNGEGVAEKMRIMGNGNVGIGVTAPGNILTLPIASATDPIADSWTNHCLADYKDIGTETVEMIQSAAKDKIKNTPVSVFTKKAIITDEEAEREPKQKYQDKIKESAKADLELYTAQTGVNMQDNSYVNELLDSMWETKADRLTIVEANKQKLTVEKKALPKFQRKNYGIMAEDAPPEAQVLREDGSLQGVDPSVLIGILWANAQKQEARTSALETKIEQLKAIINP